MEGETINKGMRYRLYPDEKQAALLRQHVGNTRFLWNQMLGLQKTTYQQTGKFVFYQEMSALLPHWKKDPKLVFLRHSHSQSLQQTCEDLDQALRESFTGAKGFPQFKRKRDGIGSFTIHQKWQAGKIAIKIPKIGWVKWVQHRPLEGMPSKITVSQDGDQWYVSVSCEVSVTPQPLKSQEELRVVGVDLGIKTLATLSDGTAIENPRHLQRYEKQLKRLQRSLARTSKERDDKGRCSSGRFKAKCKLQRKHRKIRHCRESMLHQVSSALIQQFDVIGLEDLNIQGMMQNHCLAKAIADVGWGELKRQLEYKAAWYGKTVIFVDRYFPSSKRCSRCHHVKESLQLSERTFHCEHCGLTIDRDLNAALNIQQEAFRLFLERSSTAGLAGIDAGGHQVRPKAKATPKGRAKAKGRVDETGKICKKPHPLG